MAVLAMKQIRICALAADRKPLMELVQRRGVIELRDGPADDETFSRPETSAEAAQFQRSITAAALRPDNAMLRAFVENSHPW